MRIPAWALCLLASVVGVSAPAQAQSARDLLTHASFVDGEKGAALRRVVSAERLAATRLELAPGDREAALMQATAIGYRAKLTGSRGDAIAARKSMERLVTLAPGDAERRLVLGAWHLGAVHQLGRMIAGAGLGASKSVGLAAIDKAVALGGDRALFPGLSALLRLQFDAADPRGRALAEIAVRAATPTAIDRHLRAAAAAILASVRAGDPAATRRLAARLLPLGKLGPVK